MVNLLAKRMIELVHVRRSFRRADGQMVNAVNDISLVIPEGEFVCLVGPSGCGKSTLLQILAGLLDPSDGDVVVAGKAIAGPSPDRGVVFQKDSVFPWMRVINNVEYGLKCRGVAADKRREIARQYLRQVGLLHVENAWPRELSGGMLKRVAIATVFANGGRVLMLDEPFGALDYVTRLQLQRVLLNLWGADGGGARRTVLFVTHDVDEALALADRIIVFGSGTVIDDIRVTTGRPRTPDSLLLPEMVEIKHILLHHLGLDHENSAGHADVAYVGERVGS
jgi:NitT/TauT family transport system ATP-binding protein